MKEQILQYLRESCPWRDSLIFFPSIDSTNTHARQLVATGAPHGTVLIADHQTGGRGRMGRQFHSPAGQGIYMSVILRPDCRAEQLMPQAQKKDGNGEKTANPAIDFHPCVVI